MGDSARASRKALRARLRAGRRAVPPAAAERAAAAAAQRALALPVLVRARRVGVYLASDGELDPAPLVRALWRAGRAIYLPAGAAPGGALLFRRYAPHTPLVAGAYGIAVPAGGEARLASALDVLVVPLVAFDAWGHRLGRGGGHYDRTLGARPAGARPRLLGYGYEAQRVAHLTPARWDVPLDAVVTPRRVWRRGHGFEGHAPVF